MLCYVHSDEAADMIKDNNKQHIRIWIQNKSIKKRRVSWPKKSLTFYKLSTISLKTYFPKIPILPPKSAKSQKYTRLDNICVNISIECTRATQTAHNHKL